MFVGMDPDASNAKRVGEATYVSMGEDAVRARSVVEPAFTKNVEGAMFVIMDSDASNAKRVGEATYVSMGEDAVRARSVVSVQRVRDRLPHHQPPSPA